MVEDGAVLAVDVNEVSFLKRRAGLRNFLDSPSICARDAGREDLSRVSWQVAEVIRDGSHPMKEPFLCIREKRQV